MTQPQQPVAYACYRHPDRGTYIRCQHCGRPICGDCMISAAVGFQCPDCVAQGAREMRQNELPYGGARLSRPHASTSTLIGINVAVWVAVLLTGGQTSRFGDALALMPTGLCTAADNLSYFPQAGTAAVCSLVPGAVWVPGVADGAYWQLLTSAFAHVDPLHIFMNMLSLWFIGPILERTLGRARFLAVYLLSALTGSAAVMWLSGSGTQTLGASGAIFGLIGALTVLAFKVRGDVRTVLTWLGINLVFTFMNLATISWQGHIGGLIGGLLTTAIIVYAPRKDRSRTQLLGLVAVGLITLGLIAVRIAQLS